MERYSQCNAMDLSWKRDYRSNIDEQAINKTEQRIISKFTEIGKGIAEKMSSVMDSSEIGRLVSEKLNGLYSGRKVIVNLNIFNNTVKRGKNFNTIPIQQKINNQSNKIEDSLNKQFVIEKRAKNFTNNVYRQQRQSALNEELNNDNLLSKRCSIDLSKKKNYLYSTGLNNNTENDSRLFLRKVEEIKDFWRQTNDTHPFMFKKKMINKKNDPNNHTIIEITDLSQKIIPEDEMES